MQSEPNADELLIVASDPALKFWRELGQELVKDTLKSTEEASKQVISIAAIAEGLYFHAIAYQDIRGGLEWWQILIYLVPIVLWLSSLGFALSVFFVQKYELNVNSSTAAKTVFESITVTKLRRFQVAATLLVGGMLGLVPALCLYLK